MKKNMAVLVFFLISLSGFSQGSHHFSLGKTDFLLDNKPFLIISGEMHPARIPKEYWRQRIGMAKAMGCNTIAVYIFWNYHETRPGIFDFESENRDIAEFMRICRQEGMWVLCRPGPYVCAEWDFGGLPSYLLKIPDLKIRCMDSRYMAAVEKYIHRLAEIIKPLQCDHGGPVLMLQVENEYGSYGNDKEYLETLRKLWLQNGITVPFYTADGPTPLMLATGNIDGAAIGLDSGTSEKDFDEARKRNPGVPSFSSETYPGWLTHWGEKFARPDTNDLKREVEFLLKNNKSFNLYVLHGGTNFGLTAGANAFSPMQYQPDITSYDYDAPVNEQGSPTAKFFMLRKLIAKYTLHELPALPPTPPVITVPPVQMRVRNNLWVTARGNKSFPSPQPQPMEMFDQGQGYILYTTNLPTHGGGKLTILEPHDYALVFLNRHLVDTVYRDGGKWTVDLPSDDWAIDPLLDILVEGMGHINFGQYMIDRKGITDRVTLNGMTLMNWEITPIPVNEDFWQAGQQQPAGWAGDRQGLFFYGTFDLPATGDTYFDMSGYSKGIVNINGHTLGRYWNIGPQQRLFCPASWLRKGKNEITVFDMLQLDPAPVSGKSTLE